MAQKDKVSHVLQLVKVDSVEPNHFNPNVMAPDKYEALKTEIKEKGIGFYVDAPVIVSNYEEFYGVKPLTWVKYVIGDGEHRWRAAKELEFPDIWVKILDKPEAEWKRDCYRINDQRGTLDPMKEAKMFVEESKNGGGKLTQEQIAEKYGKERTYVARRIALLNLPETVIQLLKPREAKPERFTGENEINSTMGLAETEPKKERTKTLTPSHLEALTGLPEDRVKSLAKTAIANDYSVADITRIAQQVKNEITEKKKTQEFIDSFKIKVCPLCGEPDPQLGMQAKEMRCWGEPHYSALGGSLVWHADDTKKTILAKRVIIDQKETTIEAALQAHKENKKAASAAVEKKLPDWFKYEKDKKEVMLKIGELLYKAMKEGKLVDTIYRFDVKGLKNNKPVHIELGGTFSGSQPCLKIDIGNKDWDPNELRYSGAPQVPYGDRSEAFITLEDGEWKKGPYKTRVRTGSTNPKMLQKVQQFLDKTMTGKAEFEDIPFKEAKTQ